jgi:hypothetical protein
MGRAGGAHRAVSAQAATALSRTSVDRACSANLSRGPGDDTLDDAPVGLPVHGRTGQLWCPSKGWILS